MDLRPGLRLHSTACETEVVVVRHGTGGGALQCGGRPMLGAGTAGDGAGSPLTEGPGTQLGKRYVDDTTGVEVLCTRPGLGGLDLDGRPLTVKAAKPLPASD